MTFLGRRSTVNRPQCFSGSSGWALPGLVEGLEHEGQDALGPGPGHQVAVVGLLEVLGGVLGQDALAVGAGGPAGLGDHHRLARVEPGHAVVIVPGVVDGLVDQLVLPHRVGVQGDEVHLLRQLPQGMLPGHIVLAEGDRLGAAGPGPPDQLHHPGQRHEVVGPVDGRLVAHGHREHDVPEAPGQGAEPGDFRVVLGPVGLEGLFAEGGGPGAAEVVQFGPQVGAEHDLEAHPFLADHLQHPLGVRAAVVQAQQPPVPPQEQEVLADFRLGRVGPVPRALPAPVAGIADRVPGRQLDLQHQPPRCTWESRPCPTAPSRRPRRLRRPPSRPRRRPRSRRSPRCPHRPSGRCR